MGFTRLGRREVVADFPRDPRYTVHDQRALLAQRIFSIALGHEDLNDQETLRVDPALQTTARCQPEEDQPLASPWLTNGTAARSPRPLGD